MFGRRKRPTRCRGCDKTELPKTPFYHAHRHHSGRSAPLRIAGSRGMTTMSSTGNAQLSCGRGCLASVPQKEKGAPTTPQLVAATYTPGSALRKHHFHRDSGILVLS